MNISLSSVTCSSSLHPCTSLNHGVLRALGAAIALYCLTLLELYMLLFSSAFFYISLLSSYNLPSRSIDLHTIHPLNQPRYPPQPTYHSDQRT